MILNDISLAVKGFGGKTSLHRREIIRAWVVLVLIFFLCCSTVWAREDESTPAFFQWQGLPALPRPIQGAFVGVSENALVIAGGRDSSGSQNYLDTVLVLEAEQKTWRRAKLAHPLAYGAAVSTEEGMIIIGGRDAEQCYAAVLRLKWNSAQKKLEIETLPELPQACAYCSAELVGNTIYVAGGLNSPDAKAGLKNFWALDLSQPAEMPKWQILEPWPGGPGRIQAATAVQNSGEKVSFYLFGGALVSDKDGEKLNDAYRYDPFVKERSERWKKVLDVPEPTAAGLAVDIGQSHIMLFAHKGDILTYHTITDTWVTKKGQLPEGVMAADGIKWQDKTVIVAGAGSAADKASVILSGKPTEHKAKFGIINYLTLGGYLAIMVLMGFYFSRREKSTDDFFLAGRRVPWWAAGISIYATTFSAITYIATPAKVFSTNWLYIMSSMAMLPMLPLVARYFVPYVRRLNVTTAYEYLEKRFNLLVRLFGSLVFLLFQVGRMAIVLLLPALALSTVTGINVQVCIASMGILCILYTVLGGIEAVIWTDVLQLIVLMGAALFLIPIVAADLDGGFMEIIRIGQADNKFTMINWTWDYSVAALWVVIIGNFLSNLPVYISDQSVVQRYLTTPTLKGAQRSLWLNFWIIIPNAVLFFLMGTALYAFYKTNPALLDPAIKTDSILPFFVLQKMPAGVSGLVVAGIFAASMSSLDSAMHSMSTAIVTDFYRRFKTDKTEKHYLSVARWLTGILGVVGTTTAMYMAVANIMSLWDLFMTLLGLISGGLGGVFLLGIFTRRTNGTGAFIGALASSVLVFLCQTYTPMHFFLYGAVGLVSAMVIGYLVSFMIPGKDKDLEGLTMFTLTEKKG